MSDNGILNEKLKTLLQGINEQYGSTLTDELIVRLENTIIDFNEEVDALMNELKENATIKEKMMADIKSGKKSEKSNEQTPDIDSEEDAQEMSEWEKRLESLS
ncbi:MAG: hypothetical protein H8E70_06840 [Candidatus Marinimicrobia bacterium]|nr:hypothetical protein [Candidatus Neomarinimicrobiota bacterium]MBL7110090.1 hypothetical protein [Candidatus Neomarinimicrobiota bacterium]